MKKTITIFLILISIQGIVNSSCSMDKKCMSNNETQTNYYRSVILATRLNLELVDIKNRTFPTIVEILESQIVQQQIETAKKMTINSSTPTGRREYGFWIYYNFYDSTFWCGEIEEGKLIGYDIGTGASIALPKVSNVNDVCAFCHTHTPLHHAPPGLQRTTGPSSSDINAANTWKVPGIVVDYKDSIIYSGHSLNDSCIVYPFGPVSRTIVVL